MNFRKLILKVTRINININFQDFNSYYNLIDGKLQESILIYNISYKILIGTTPFHIRFNEVDRFIRIFDGNRFLVLLGLEKYDVIYNRIRYSVSQKSGTTYVFSHYFRKMFYQLSK